MGNKLACRTAGVAAFLLWPLAVLGAFALAAIAFVFALDWVGKLIGPHPSRWPIAVLLGIAVLGFYISRGIDAYEWVQRRCSSNNGNEVR